MHFWERKKRRKNRLFVYELHPSMATRLYCFSWVPGRGSPGGGRGWRKRWVHTACGCNEAMVKKWSVPRNGHAVECTINKKLERAFPSLGSKYNEIQKKNNLAQISCFLKETRKAKSIAKKIWLNQFMFFSGTRNVLRSCRN